MKFLLRKFRKCLYLAFVFAQFEPSGVLTAQTLVNYAVTRTTGITYTSIYNTGTPYNSWRYSGGFQQDDNRTTKHDIGFDFWYNGKRYTELCVSTNGYIDFSNSVADGGPVANAYGYQNNPFFSGSGGTQEAIAPIYDDMTTQGANDPLGNSIRYLVSGTAPNRVLTVDWRDMAVYLNTTPSLNFQVKLYETTGVIEFIYGNMINGTAGFSYSCGLNSNPGVFQLRTQQTANTNTFGAAAQNNLLTLPATNSRLQFTPPVPLNPSGALTFTGITSTGMTLNWTNWASNEVGYVVYYSSDGINYDFATQTAANATSTAITGLLPATNYFWRVYAVTEGALSNPLNGTQATGAAGTFISIASGNWNTNTTWSANAVPTAADNVIIANGHTVTINANTFCNNLTVGQGGAATLRIGNNGTARAVNVNGTLTVNANATFNVNAASNITHSLLLRNNVINNGTFDMATDAASLCNVTFSKQYGSISVSGTGGVTRFNLMTLDMNNLYTNVVDFTTSNFSAAADFLTINSGTFKFSVVAATTLNPFNGAGNIPQYARIWMNSAASTMNFTGGNLNLYGYMSLSVGTVNVGSAANQNIVSFGGAVFMQGGNMNIAGRLDRQNSTMLTRLDMSGGILRLPTVGSTSATVAPFSMDISGSTFKQSGGTIIILREGGTGAQDLGFNCAGATINNVIGGTLQIGDATTPVGQIMSINSVSPVGNLFVNSANATARLLTNQLQVIQDVTIASGILNANNLNLQVGRNWSNTGGTYTPGTNTTTFYSLTAAGISKTAQPETFNHLLFANAGIKTLGSNISCQNLTINAGATLDAGAGSYTVNMAGNWSSAGTYNGQTNGTVNCNGTMAQTISGNSPTSFRHLTINNAAGASITTAQNLLGTLTLTNGVFTTTGQNFTLISNASGTARIAAITGGNITGNINMQRYLPGILTGWRQLGTAVTGQTLTNWNDDFVTTGFPGSQFPTFPFINVYTYNETAAGPKEFGYVPASNITNNIPSGTGFFIYMGPTPFTVDLQGPPGKFAQNFALSYTPSAGATQDGWNMVANPYPSTIDWDAPGWTKTNVATYVQIWNAGNQQYASYQTSVGGINGGSRYVPSSQAFWVHAVGPAPAIAFGETVKDATDQAFIRMSPSQLTNTLRLRIDGNNHYDETLIHFDPLATNGYDPNFDAIKWFSPADSVVPSLSSVMSPDDYAINSMPWPGGNISIPLRVKAARTHSGTYVISRDTVFDLPSSMCIVLEDLATGTMTDLTTTLSYSFNLPDTTLAPRFLLHIGSPVIKDRVMVSCPNGNNGIAIAEGIGSGPWDYIWEDTSGNTVASHLNISGPDSLFNCVGGAYTVTVNGNSGLCGTLSDTILISSPMPFSAINTITGTSCPGEMDGAINVFGILGGTMPYTYEWSTTDNTMSVSGLSVGNYWLVVNDAAACSDTIHFIMNSQSTLDAQFTMSDDTVYIGQNNMVIFSNYSPGATSYTWTFGDISQPNYNSNPFHVYAVPGTYTVQLVVSDSTCTDTLQQVIVVIDATGITSQQLEQDVTVQQNEETAFVQFNLSREESAIIDVYDASGKKMMASLPLKAFNNRVRLPLNQPPQGIYLVRIIVGREQYIRRVRF